MIHIPPALVLGCNTLHGINVLSDYIQEQTGYSPEFHESGWTCDFYNVYPIQETGYGYGYGFGIYNGNGSGDGFGYGYGNFNGVGIGIGNGYGFANFSNNNSNGDGSGYGEDNGDGIGNLFVSIGN